MRISEAELEALLAEDEAHFDDFLDPLPVENDTGLSPSTTSNAQGSERRLSEAEIEAILAEESFEQAASPFFLTADLTMRSGYHSNVTLANSNRQDSGFVQPAFTTFATYTPNADWSSYLFAIYERTHFTHQPEALQFHISDEQLALVNAQTQYRLSAEHHVGLSARYLFLDQFVDASDPTLTANVRIKLHLLSASAQWSWQLADTLELASELQLERHYYEELTDDLHTYTAKTELTHHYGPQETSHLSIKALTGYLVYDQREAKQADGTPLNGQLTRLLQPAAELEWQHAFENIPGLSLKLGPDVRLDIDPQAGYYNSLRLRNRARLRYVFAPLSITLEGSHTWTDYLEREPQGTPPQVATWNETIAVESDLEWAISEHWITDLKWRFERNHSDSLADEYLAHTVTLGLTLRL